MWRNGMTNLRLKFSRKGPVAYLGHLDILRYFQKAIARAEIDIKYSEGFNPHMILSFAYPLGVSMETEGDYADITVNTYNSLEDIKDSLNSVMNEGISIISVSIVPDDALNAMASVALADYSIKVDADICDDQLKSFMKENQIMILKEGKKGMKEVDIKPGIRSLEIQDERIFMSLKSGSGENIKPVSVIEALSNFLKIDINIELINRIEIYKESEEGQFVPLGEF